MTASSPYATQIGGGHRDRFRVEDLAQVVDLPAPSAGPPLADTDSQRDSPTSRARTHAPNTERPQSTDRLPTMESYQAGQPNHREKPNPPREQTRPAAEVLGLLPPSSDVEREAGTDEGLRRERQKEDERAAIVDNREDEYRRFKKDIVEGPVGAPGRFVRDAFKKPFPGSS